MIRLQTLGSLDLVGPDGDEIRSVIAQPKRLALLSFLALSPGGMQRRDRLLSLFWPESDEEHARGSLRQAVAYLRRSLGAGVLVNRGEEEIGVAESTLWCDAAEFQRRIAGDDAASAMELYRGDLMDGFIVSDAPEFEDWLAAERTRLRDLAAKAALALSRAGEEAGDSAAALSWANRALALAPDDESTLRWVLALMARGDDRVGVVRTYEQFARRLAEDYGMEPALQTQSLVAEIRSHAVAPPQTRGRREDTDDGAAAVGSTARPASAAESDSGPGPLEKGRKLALLAGAAAVVLLSVASLKGVILPTSKEPELTPHRVVISPFENRTGDASLNVVGSMAADWIIQGISRAELGEVVPITAALASRTHVAGLSYLTDSAARMRELARETGAGTVVYGSYYLQGDTLLFHARITDVAGGRVIAVIETVAAPVSAPLEGIDLLRTRMLAALAPVSDRRETHARAAIRPPTFDSYAAYIAGMEAFVRFDMPEALRNFERSASADTAYPLPLLASAIALMNMGRLQSADSITRVVEHSRDVLGPFETATLDMVQGWMRGDNVAAYQAVVRQARLAPGSVGHYQVAEQARRLNRPAEAIRVLREIDPERGELRGWTPYWREATAAHHMLGNHRQELREARRARALNPDNPGVLALEVRALAALGRTRDLDSLLEERKANPSTSWPEPGALMQLAAQELHSHGFREPARELHGRAVDWYRTLRRTHPGDHRRAHARALYTAGKWAEAETLFRELASEDPEDVHLQGYLGTLAARRGDRARAEQISGRLSEMRQPYLWGANSYWRACIAAHLGEREQAVQLLRDAFSQGRQYGPHLHTDIDLEPLADYAPFRELIRPKS
jgi:DNA-binding SARP family transcriptional activator/tetratricopeptide (TPR) repeat protein/TolB-like protein